jgi:hypothetical protein
VLEKVRFWDQEAVWGPEERVRVEWRERVRWARTV